MQTIHTVVFHVLIYREGMAKNFSAYQFDKDENQVSKCPDLFSKSASQNAFINNRLSEKTGHIITIINNKNKLIVLFSI